MLFSRLSRENLTGIIDIQLGYLRKLLKAQRLDIEVSEDAKKWIGDKGYDPVYGARPLKRVIQTELQNELAELILKGEFTEGETVKVTLKDDKLVFDA